MSTQLELQASAGGTQFIAHTPLLQKLPAAHVFPHAPQLEGSVCVFTQVPPQGVDPSGQTHEPSTQVRPPEHKFPHAPQFAFDDISEVPHMPSVPHVPKPGRHCAEHDPFEHTGVEFVTDGQLTWHAPQLLVSKAVATSQPFTGLPSQSAVPGAQSIPQLPPVHVAVESGPNGHTRPGQLPQWSGSVSVFVHEPMQSVSVPGQAAAHEFCEHTGVAVRHRVPHAPQFNGSDTVRVSQPTVAAPSQSA